MSLSSSAKPVQPAATTSGFYMKVPLPDGSYTDGRVDYTAYPSKLGLDALDWSALRVLDVATNDGFWAFWAEQQGARDILAIDVDSFEGYDWGKSQRDDVARRALQTRVSPLNWQGGTGFWQIHKAWNSNVRRETLSVYDLSPNIHGTFDVVFCFGLLYHLRHPLLALDRLRAVCRGALVIETHIVQTQSALPVSLFYWDDAFRGDTNWTGPTEAACLAWLKSAGFEHFLARRPHVNVKNGREVVLALLNAQWKEQLRRDGLTEFDDRYFQKMRAAVREYVGEM